MLPTISTANLGLNFAGHAPRCQICVKGKHGLGPENAVLLNLLNNMYPAGALFSYQDKMAAYFVHTLSALR